MKTGKGVVSGAVIIVFVLVFVVPIAATVCGAVLAGVLGQSLWRDADTRHAGSELAELSS